MDNASEKAGRQTDYLSYLLRLWQESEKGAVWRASLQSPDTGERVGFASLDKLFDFLQRQTGGVPDPGGGQDVGQKRGNDDTTTKQSHTLS